MKTEEAHRMLSTGEEKAEVVKTIDMDKEVQEHLKEYDEKYVLKAHKNFFSSQVTARYVLWKPTENIEEVKNEEKFNLRILSVRLPY